MIWVAAVLFVVGQTAAQTVPCGVPAVSPATKRIVGGKESNPNSWPWMVMLVDDLDYISGGGAIIGSRTIVTSAQHFMGTGFTPDTINIQQWKVFLGEHSINKDDPLEKAYAVKSVKVHENFNPTTLFDDIALIFLNETITFNRAVSPICLADNTNKVAAGQTCYLAGWGSTAGSGNEDVLNQVDMPVLADSACQQHFKDFIPGKEICAGWENTHKDFCGDDIGNPLVCQGANNAWYVQGLASSGGDCTTADEPGVFEDVAEFNMWIKNAMAAENDAYQY